MMLVIAPRPFLMMMFTFQPLLLSSVAANSSVEVVAVDADADSIAVNTEVVAVADNIEVGSVDNHCRRGFQLLKMVGGSGAALRAVSTAEKIIEYFSCAIKLVPCDNGRRHFVFDTGWSF